MRRRTTIFCATAVALSFGGGASAQDSQRGCEALASTSIEVLGFTITGAIGSDDREAFCDVLNETLKTIDGLQTRVTSLEGQLEATKAQIPPRGSILLVDHADGCPKVGWRDLAEDDPAVFAGRMALAATGDGPYRYRATGGTTEHMLTIAEMPKHSHPLPVDAVPTGRSQPSLVGTKNADEGIHGNPPHSGSTGGGQPHNNMPPYIALYFCKKEG